MLDGLEHELHHKTQLVPNHIPQQLHVSRVWQTFWTQSSNVSWCMHYAKLAANLLVFQIGLDYCVYIWQMFGGVC